MQSQPWTYEVITICGPDCSHIAFCMVADHMHVYSVMLPGMLVHKLLTELLLDVAVTICLSMLASNINRCNSVTLPGPVLKSVLHPCAVPQTRR